MSSEWAQQRLRKWLDEVIDLNKRKIGFRIPELLDEVRKETAARCAEMCETEEILLPLSDWETKKKVSAATAVALASEIRREFGLEE